MTESESVALPLGDAAIFSTSVIITERLPFVNTKMKISPKSFDLFFVFFSSFFSMPQNAGLYTADGTFLQEFDEGFLCVGGCKTPWNVI